MSMTPNATLQFLLGRVPADRRGQDPAPAKAFEAVLAAAADGTGDERIAPRDPRQTMLPAVAGRPARPEAAATENVQDAVPRADIRAAVKSATPAAGLDAAFMEADAEARTDGPRATPASLATPTGQQATASPQPDGSRRTGPGAPVPVMPPQALPGANTDPATRKLSPTPHPDTPKTQQIHPQEPVLREQTGEAILQRLTEYLTAAPSDREPLPGTPAAPLPPQNTEAPGRQPHGGAVESGAIPVPPAANLATATTGAQPARAQPAPPAPKVAARQPHAVEADRTGTAMPDGNADEAHPTTRDGARDPFRGHVLPLRRGVAVHVAPQDKPALAAPNDAITVTRRETHFAPVRRPAAVDAHLWTRSAAPETAAAPARELPKPSFAAIAEQVKPAFEQLRADLETRAPQLLQAQQAATAGKFVAPVRVMEIALQPASLGALAVTMRITGTGLRVSISASQRETALALEEDIEKLTALVREAGFDPEAVDIVHGGGSVATRLT